ncbi:glycosyltransferase [Enterococcus sp. AZ126]|uniref:glycosyltransferase n=1 Tax=Enterococcus sp. AZ126 TaxID=2774635 RepID=UPI003F22EEC4
MKVITKKNIAVVVLHYITIADTIECVHSICELNQGMINLQIIIVDNGSPNDSGNRLFDYFKNNQNVKVLLSKENLGFAKGNNMGFSYAKEYLNPDFILLVNNDIFIKQNDFFIRLIKNYESKKFDISGPKIISTVNGINQNPTPKLFFRIQDVKKMQLKFKIYHILSLFHVDLWLKKFLNRNNKKDMENLEYEEFQLHGACLIFSKDYIKKYNGLNVNTFMYMEEFILKYIAERDLLVMSYLNDISIFHKEDSSTNAYLKSNIQKRRFFYKHSIHSSQVLIDLMRESE